MQEIYDQLFGYLKGIWNKRWHAMLLTWLCCLIGWVYVYQMPDQFESKAKIYIDTQSLLRPLLRGLTVQTDTSQEINLMVKTLLTRPNVEKIIRLADLDLSVNNENEFDFVVKNLQKNIKFDKSRRSRVNIYNISYANQQAKIAYRVLQSVITVFVENSIGHNKEESSSARSFIEKQIAEYEKRLTDAENRLKLFKQKNMGVLPSSQGDYYSRMEQTKSKVLQIELELKETEREKVTIQNELNSLIMAVKKSLSAENNTLVQTSYDSRIEKLQSDFDDLLLKYTDSHPDVKAIKRVLFDLEKKRLTELMHLRDAVSSTGSALDSNPIYQTLRINLGALNSKIGSLKVRLHEYQNRLASLLKRVDHIPEVEAQLTALNRDYDITKKKYEELLVRRESATLSENINKTTDGIQFNVIDPPRIAKYPTGPNRILLSSVVLLLAFGAGLGFAFVLSQIKPIFHSAREFELALSLPILGTVGAVTSVGQNKRRILLVLTYLSLFLLLLVMYAALVAWYMSGFWAMVAKIQEQFLILFNYIT